MPNCWQRPWTWLQTLAQSDSANPQLILKVRVLYTLKQNINSTSQNMTKQCFINVNYIYNPIESSMFLHSLLSQVI